MKKIFGVFGDPIAHSLSPAMHNAAFSALGMEECMYLAFRVRKENLRDAIYGAAAMGFGGLNLTIPLKEEALSVVNADPLARKIGAVNVVDFKDGITGYNTDGLGAKMALEEKGIRVRGKHVLIIGAGGAARAIAFQFAEEGAAITIANRTEERAVALANDVVRSAGRSGKTATGTGLDGMAGLIKDADILINTTSVGMHPHVDETVASADMMRPGLVVFDIVYNPLKTALLKEAQIAGATPVEGIMMLVYQGAEAFRIWTGRYPPVDVMKESALKILKLRRRTG